MKNKKELWFSKCIRGKRRRAHEQKKFIQLIKKLYLWIPTTGFKFLSGFYKTFKWNSWVGRWHTSSVNPCFWNTSWFTSILLLVVKNLHKQTDVVDRFKPKNMVVADANAAKIKYFQKLDFLELFFYGKACYITCPFL